MILIPLTSTPLSKSRQSKLENLYYSRLSFVVPALILKLLIMIPLMRSFLFFVAIFNLPAMLALFLSLFQPQLFNLQIHKSAKFCLKIGMAKAVGGLLLVSYMVFEYLYVLKGLKGNTDIMRTYVIYLGGSSLVDVLYSLLAIFAVKKTKEIIKVLKPRNPRRRHISDGAILMKSTEDDSVSCKSGSSL